MEEDRGNKVVCVGYKGSQGWKKVEVAKWYVLDTKAVRMEEDTGVLCVDVSSVVFVGTRRTNSYLSLDPCLLEGHRALHIERVWLCEPKTLVSYQ